MGMSVSEYLRRKNEIVREATGVILVPEDQIVNTKEIVPLLLVYYEPVELSKYGFLEAGFCPYCLLYADNECKNCPMYEAGNHCGQTKGNTWATANKAWMGKSTEKDWKKLRNLVVEYNKQFGSSKIN